MSNQRNPDEHGKLRIYGEVQRLMEAIIPLLEAEPNWLARQFALETLLAEVLARIAEGRGVSPISYAEGAVAAVIDYVANRRASGLTDNKSK